MRSAAPGATTPIRVAPATCPRTCTRSRSSRRPIGAGYSAPSRRFSVTSRASRTSTGCAATSTSARTSIGHTGTTPNIAGTSSPRTAGSTSRQFLISGAGALHIPSLPPIAGLEDFAGPLFHTAQWDHGVDLAGKRVAVIGTGASAIQVVPELVKIVDQVQLYQRTPAWIKPRIDIAFPSAVKRLFAVVPGCARPGGPRHSGRWTPGRWRWQSGRCW